MAAPKQDARSAAETAKQPSPGLSQAAREYRERGFLGNIKHALGQVADKAPKAARQALSRTAKEFRENKELREKTAMALGAGSLPIMLASGLAAAEYVPAALARAAYSLGGDKALGWLWALTDSRASKAVQEFVTGYLPGGPPEMTWPGLGGATYGRYEDEIHGAVKNAYGSLRSNNEK